MLYIYIMSYVKCITINPYMAFVEKVYNNECCCRRGRAGEQSLLASIVDIWPLVSRGFVLFGRRHLSIVHIWPASVTRVTLMLTNPARNAIIIIISNIEKLTLFYVPFSHPKIQTSPNDLKFKCILFRMPMTINYWIGTISYKSWKCTICVNVSADGRITIGSNDFPTSAGRNRIIPFSNQVLTI